MKHIVNKVLPIAVVLVLVGAGCSKATSTVEISNNNLQQSVQSSAPQPAQSTIATTDCKNDAACADRLWVQCQVGSFNFVQNGTLVANVMVTGKRGAGCMVNWSYAEEYLKTGGPTGEIYKDKSMSCAINSTDKSAISGFDSYIKTEAEAGFKDCSGSLKDILNELTRAASLAQ